jgi:hypothetical protein
VTVEIDFAVFGRIEGIKFANSTKARTMQFNGPIKTKSRYEPDFKAWIHPQLE